MLRKRAKAEHKLGRGSDWAFAPKPVRPWRKVWRLAYLSRGVVRSCEAFLAKLVVTSRASGILLHPTSLPGRYGIGDLGPEAYRFADWLAAAGQRIWQVLPLGPVGYGESPYQLFSAFAGNPLLISPDAPCRARLARVVRSHRRALLFRRIGGFRARDPLEDHPAAQSIRAFPHAFAAGRSRSVRNIRPRPLRLAARVRPLHGAQGSQWRPHVDRMGQINRSPIPRTSKYHEFVQFEFFRNGAP